MQLSIEHLEAVLRCIIASDQTHTLLEQHEYVEIIVSWKVSQIALKKVHKQFRKAQHFAAVLIICIGTFRGTLWLPCVMKFESWFQWMGNSIFVTSRNMGDWKIYLLYPWKWWMSLWFKLPSSSRNVVTVSSLPTTKRSWSAAFYQFENLSPW